MKKAIGLALVVLMTSVVAASAQGAHKVAVSAASSQAINCSSTMTIPFLTPPFIGAFAWILALQPKGYLAQLTGQDWPTLEHQALRPAYHPVHD